MNKVTTTSLLVFGISFFVALLIGSNSSKNATSLPIQVTPNFDFKPPVEGAGKPTGISLILLHPRYDKEYLKYYRGTEPDKTFIENMGSDFVEMLVARGFTYVGPIASYDDLVYSQKKNSDLVMEVEMSWEANGLQNALRVQNYTDYITKQVTRKYWYDGQGSLGGRLNMWLYEPFTQQKVWVKAINIPASPIYYKTYYRYEQDRVLVSGTNQIHIPETDPLLWNALVPEMEKIYKSMLNTAWNHLEPEELKQIKKEANEIGVKSGYNRN
jgi:hypothetical protein